MRNTIERSGSLWVPSRREMLGALGVGLLAPRIARAATFSLIAHAGGGLGASPPQTLTLDTTGADLVVVGFVHDPGSGTVTVSDSKGNTWIPLTPRSNTVVTQLWYARPSNSSFVGASHIIAFGAAATFYASGYVAAFSGANASPFETETGLATGGSTLQPGNINPGHDNELIVSAVSVFGTAPTVSGMAMLDASSFTGSQFYGGGMAYVIQTTAAAINPTWAGGALLSPVMASFTVSTAAPKTRHRVTGGD